MIKAVCYAVVNLARINRKFLKRIIAINGSSVQTCRNVVMVKHEDPVLSMELVQDCPLAIFKVVEINVVDSSW